MYHFCIHVYQFLYFFPNKDKSQEDIFIFGTADIETQLMPTKMSFGSKRLKMDITYIQTYSITSTPSLWRLFQCVKIMSHIYLGN